MIGEGFVADVAAHLGPLVLLPGEHGTHEADRCCPVGEMPTTSLRRRISGSRPASPIPPPGVQLRRAEITTRVTALGSSRKAVWMPSSARTIRRSTRSRVDDDGSYT